jgi:hypothetical protein
LARQHGFNKDVGTLGFFLLDFCPLVKKVGHPCPTLSLNLLLKFNSNEMLPNDRNNCERFLPPQA